MKSIVILAIVLLNTLMLSSQTRYNIQRKVDGYNREFIVVVPSKAPPVGGYPLVMMLHGTSGDGEKFYNISGWKELGEEENFVTVFPSSLSWCFIEDGVEKNNTRWINGNVTDNPCSGPPQNYVDDVKFLKIVIQLIKDTLPINKSKVYASGFSNGCSMIHKLAVDAGDVFSAVAGSSAPMAMGDSALPIKRIPVWYMLGTLDDRYFFPPATELPFGRDSILDYLAPFLHRAIVCQGLSENFVFRGDDSSHVYLYNESKNGGISTSPYVFSLNKGQIHEFPNGINYPLNAPKLFWDFFKKSTVVSNQSISTDHLKLEVFPNPSNNVIHIKLENSDRIKSYNLKVFNAFGELVYQQLNHSNSDIDVYKESLGIGLFLVKVESGNQFESKLISVY